MCAIIGASSKNKIDPSVIKIMYVLAQNRGTDATGFATKDFIQKKALDSVDFLADFAIPEVNNFIGHTRAATSGAKNKDENAHPFREGKIVGAHNGGISNFYDLKGKENRQDMDVDSNIIFHLINEEGLNETTKKLQGSFAICYYHTDDDTIYLYRHNNPIYYGSKDGGIFFGSEENYLKAIDCTDIESLPEHHIGILKDGILTIEEQEKEFHPKAYTNWTRYGRYGYHDDYYNYYPRDNDSPISEYDYLEDDYEWKKIKGKWEKVSTKVDETSHKLTSNHAPKDARSYINELGKVFFWFSSFDYLTLKVAQVYNNLTEIDGVHTSESLFEYKYYREEHRKKLLGEFPSIYKDPDIQKAFTAAPPNIND